VRRSLNELTKTVDAKHVEKRKIRRGVADDVVTNAVAKVAVEWHCQRTARLYYVAFEIKYLKSYGT